MALPPGVKRIFRLVVRSRSVAADVDQELDFHLAQTVDDLVRRGWNPAEARAEAERRFGGREAVAREVRRLDRHREAWWDRRLRLTGLGQDLRQAVRSLVRSPGFAAVAVATFGLGIGANVAVFTVLDGVVLRPLPYPEPDRIVRIYEHDRREGRPYGSITIADFRDWQDQSSSFAAMAAFRWRSATIVTPDRAMLFPAAQVSASFFDVLGVRPALGRGFRPGDDAAGAAPTAILSDAAWRRWFGADSDLIGRPIRLNGSTATVIGVLPRSFITPSGGAVDVWMPSDFHEIADDPTRARWMHFLSGYARVRSGVALSTAIEELRTIGRRLAAEHPRENEGHEPNPIPVAQADVRNVKPVLMLTTLGVAALLVLACANLANLVLARALARGRELGIRAALGAGRARLARAVLVEQGLLAGLGALAGVGVASAASRGLLALLGDALPRASRVTIDGRVLAFAVGIAVLAAVTTGLVPALLAVRLDLQSVLRSEGHGTTAQRRSHRIRNWLVAVQVALAVLLAAGSGLVVRSLSALLHVELGFVPEGVVTFEVPLRTGGYDGAQAIRGFEDRFLERLRRLPGVTSAAAGYSVPMRNVSTTSFRREGEPSSSRPAPEVGYNAVGPGYFETLGIPIVAGRDFAARDRPGSPGVVIVNRAFVRRFLGEQEPLGVRIRSGPGERSPWLEIVGVVGDIRRASVEEAPVPELYFALTQDVTSNPAFVVASSASAAVVLEQARRELNELDPELPMAEPESMSQVVDRIVARPRFLGLLLSTFAALALALAAIGVHGVIAFLVAERTREIGVRRALGAGSGSVVRDVLRRGLAPVVVGAAVGLLAALALGPLARDLLYGVTPRDPLTLALVMAVTLIAGLAGCLVPTRRAIQVDPMAALRE
jgi:putative ABC transport system permease protein